MVRYVRCSEQNTIEVDAIVIDPVLHCRHKAQELQGAHTACQPRSNMGGCKSFALEWGDALRHTGNTTVVRSPYRDVAVMDDSTCQRWWRETI